MKKERKHPKEPAYPLPPFRTLKLERTASALGGWPVYTVTVDEHGKVRWNGRDFVKEKGKRSWTIPEAKVKLLNELLTKYDLLNINSSMYIVIDYYGVASCITTAVFKDGSRKQVLHYMRDDGNPASLSDLENRIEAILGVSKYAGSVFKS
jgi:hypothetical protein